MPMEQVEYNFPDPDKTEVAKEVEVDMSEDIATIEVEGAVGREEIGKPKAESKEEVEIEIVDDTPEKDKGKTPSNFKEVDDEELESYSKSVKKRIGQLNKAIHDERRAKEVAERQSAELTRISKPLFAENERLKGTVNKNQAALLAQAKTTVAAEMEAAKRQYKDAYEAGDSEAIVTANEALTQAKIRSDKVENFKPAPLQTDSNKIQVPADGKPQVSRDQRADSWAKDNSWFGTDDEMTAFALGLDSKLKKNGVDPRSDEYYEKLDSRLREVFSDYEFGDSTNNSAKPKQRSSNVVAPATRSTSPKKVTLSQTQVALAKRLGVSLEDYAKQAAVLMRKQND